jgi:hypothetical protein
MIPPDLLTDDRPVRVCIHEAGHALITRSVGGNVWDITIDRETHGGLTEVWPGSHALDEDGPRLRLLRMLINAGGYAAECYYCGKGAWECASGDRQHFGDHLGWLQDHAPRWIISWSQAVRMNMQTIHRHRQGLVRLATAVYVQGALSGGDAEDLLGRVERGPLIQAQWQRPFAKALKAKKTFA